MTRLLRSIILIIRGRGTGQAKLMKVSGKNVDYINFMLQPATIIQFAANKLIHKNRYMINLVAGGGCQR